MRILKNTELFKIPCFFAFIKVISKQYYISKRFFTNHSQNNYIINGTKKDPAMEVLFLTFMNRTYVGRTVSGNFFWNLFSLSEITYLFLEIA